MSRWTDTDEFKAFLGEVRARYNLFSDEERPHYEAYSKALYILNEYLEDVPSLELIRCGECKWEWTQKCPPHRMGLIHDVNDFCSYGVRKEI